MNESYVECMVARKNSPVLSIVKYIIYILTGVSLIGFIAGNIFFLVTLVIFGLLVFFVVPGFELEYEYLYVDKEIQIDKIMSKEKRKKVRNIELSKMDFMCPINSHQLDRYKARNIKKSDYSSGEQNAPVWVIVYKDQMAEELVAFEPNEEMIKVIKSVFPRKVIEY
ncbi:MAG: DUF6106 family protein [Lachnospiraceae bacterium]|nr:DUF6106 family protein [Lachnospiraceae bacterium]